MLHRKSITVVPLLSASLSVLLSDGLSDTCGTSLFPQQMKKWFSLMSKTAHQYAHDQTSKPLNARYIEMVKLYIACKTIT